MNYIKKAFSLIELSIVILIIGILVAGVTQSSRLVKAMRLQTARQLTTNSPVSAISNLAAWYDSVSVSSFNESDQQDQVGVTNWYDLNPLSTTKANLTPVGVNNQPKYIENAFNGLPGIRFDGSDDYLRSDNISIIGSQVTYFIVSKRRAFNLGASVFTTLSQGATFDNTSAAHFRAFYENTGNTMSPFRNGWGTQSSHPGDNVNFIACSIFNGSTNINFVNGVTSLSAASTGNFNVSTIIVGVTWQSGALNNPWNGDVAEIIIFSRALKTDERQDVEKYLAKKWSIALS